MRFRTIPKLSQKLGRATASARKPRFLASSHQRHQEGAKARYLETSAKRPAQPTKTQKQATLHPHARAFLLPRSSCIIPFFCLSTYKHGVRFSSSSLSPDKTLGPQTFLSKPGCVSQKRVAVPETFLIRGERNET